MNYLISVGIKNCRDEAFGEIECAYGDADLIYETLNEVLCSDFSVNDSVCLKGPSSEEFLAVVKMFTRNLGESDNLIIYFSGHGALRNQDSLELIFSNANSSYGEGRCKTSQLKDVLDQGNFQTILILDCCHSGAGLNIANDTNIFSNEKISVLASSSAFGRAKFDESGSIFTKHLCDVLKTLNEEGKPISLRALAEEIESTGHRCYVNTSNGSPNIILSNPTTLVEDNTDFQKRFLMRIYESDTTTREMHWYYLMDFPNITKLEVLRSYLKQDISEPHWLVRRAIGSLIGELRNFKVKEEIVLELLRSRDWMAQCIGLIGARKELEHESIRNEVKSILSSNAQMDAIWLANLYLSDSEYLDIDCALSSSLSKTAWGVLDIWIRYSERMDNNILLEKIKSTVDNVLLEPLFIHMYFESGHIEDEGLLEPIRESKLISFLYALKKRGGTKSAKQKWLFSSLYGSWRDQLDLKLREFFHYSTEEEIRTNLELASKLPLVEMKMAIFQYITIYPDPEYHPLLKWGLSDPHPWVKRTAIRALQEQSTLLGEAFQEATNGQLYPGKLDFILEAISLGIDCNDYIVKHALIRSETESIKWATQNILKEGRISV
ncbi:caspase family protein [Bacillus cereus]|uniref:caspase family protein n=1 Tax=Bacillus cereus TaxID=1396 RepID=UPI001D05FA5E|nr:caspase family protein [Bacillus cereus]MCB5903805.1 caspase family protein [Bacillus cereus]